jgi:putative oxidoreductase
MGRLFVAALFLPSGFHKLMAFSAYGASLKAKGLPFAVLWAVLLIAVEVLGPLALIIGAWPRWTALALVAFTAVTLWLHQRASFAGALFRPRQNAELYRTLAIMGGLLFYFASGSGAWSWKGSSSGRASKA